MAIDHVDRAIVARGHTLPARLGPVRPIARRISSVGHGASELIRRVVVRAFAIIQSVLGAGVAVLRLVDRAARRLVSRVVGAGQRSVRRAVGILRREPA